MFNKLLFNQDLNLMIHCLLIINIKYLLLTVLFKFIYNIKNEVQLHIKVF